MRAAVPHKIGQYSNKNSPNNTKKVDRWKHKNDRQLPVTGRNLLPGILIVLFYARLIGFCSSATKDLLSILKAQKSKYSPTSGWSECTKSCSKENARTFSKNFTTQNISISTSRVKTETKKPLDMFINMRKILVILLLTCKVGISYASIVNRIKYLSKKNSAYGLVKKNSFISYI